MCACERERGELDTHRHETYTCKRTHHKHWHRERKRKAIGRANERSTQEENSVIEEPLRVFDVRGGACSLPTLKYPYRQQPLSAIFSFLSACIFAQYCVCYDGKIKRKKNQRIETKKRENEKQTCFSVLYRVHSV